MTVRTRPILMSISLVLVLGLAGPLGCGGDSDDEGSTEGTTDEGTTDEGTTDEGTTDEGTTDEGTTDEGTTDEGTTDEGTTDEGTTDEGTTDEGTTDEGTTDEGTTDGAPTSCDSDKDCTAEGKICDPLTESCVSCLTDAECDESQHCILLNCQDYTACSNSLGCVDAMGPDKEAQPICDSDIGECSACLSAADCPESHDCTAKQCVPYQSCKNSTDCGADEVCDKSTGRCVNCLTSNDCSTNSLCEAGLCKAFIPCVSDKDCTSQGLLCDSNKTKCAQCLEHADCPAIYNCQAIGVDGTGVCVVDACAQEQGACSNNAQVTCNATGDNYGSPEPCPAETTCLAPGGSPDCEAWVCTPNEATCTDNTAELCSGDGLSVASTTQCDNNSQKCIAGECIDTVCTPNESKCNQVGTAIETCKADGLGVVTQNCPEGSTICEDATCKAIICSSDTTFCDGTTVKQCNSTGTAAEDFADCDPEKQACLGGACVNKSCTPGTAVCNGLLEVQTCNADGLGFATTDCGSGFACKDGECNKQVCTPNTTLCVGTEIHQCGTLGLTASQVKDCAGQGKVCLNGVCTDQICTPNTSYCNGNKVMQCDATGISESIKQTCSSNQYCASGGSCKAQVCTPISVFCDDQKLMTCNTNGSASETTQDCTATGTFCIENACVDAPPGSKDNPALSCKAILDAQASTGDGTYWIDPDEAGAKQSFQVYCDMTTDGGGWTLSLWVDSDHFDPQEHLTASSGTVPPTKKNEWKEPWSGYASIGATQVLFACTQTKDSSLNYWMFSDWSFFNAIDQGTQSIYPLISADQYVGEQAKCYATTSSPPNYMYLTGVSGSCGNFSIGTIVWGGRSWGNAAGTHISPWSGNTIKWPACNNSVSKTGEFWIGFR